MTAETRFVQTPDGTVWTSTAPSYRFWTRYLSVFDTVRVVARVQAVAAVPEGAHQVDGPGVEVWPVPYYLGPRQYLLRRAAVGRAVTASADPGDAVILRVPSAIGSLLAQTRDRLHLPYALEVVGDPYDVFAPGVVQHPLRPMLRHWFATKLRRQCRSASAVAYVTERSLQARYPATRVAPTTACSSVDLPAEAFLPQARSPERCTQTNTVISVGSLDQLYKGVDTLIEALAWLIAAGLPVRLVHVGDGRFRHQLEQLAVRLGMADRVEFTGALPAGEAIRRQLDAADLFVMPSRTEGLPRALIEAMARALPAIGTTAGGIPELLPATDLVPPDDPATLAVAIYNMLTNPHRMASASIRNLYRAHDFSADTLTPRRNAYYHAVRDATERRMSVRSQVC
ncbi:hypothetical protein GCM10027280_40350 [Micromonospora polyrhachis]|uniref:Glycosyltransferase involved in cell wall biosynthesis n=1 Tax=Micromonospora polyrhachis TaxID=1282883 RepID=A0A7W7WME2_9ACTN|nr:glycosyltransferase [Micromonospora polyrhachis]MBB4956735.1 glycosyltransferase involved in cell wall biosynthesis [Micromonospora polyrhachis]